jgi:hypothetical protein
MVLGKTVCGGGQGGGAAPWNQKRRKCKGIGEGGREGIGKEQTHARGLGLAARVFTLLASSFIRCGKKMNDPDSMEANLPAGKIGFLWSLADPHQLYCKIRYRGAPWRTIPLNLNYINCLEVTPHRKNKKSHVLLKQLSPRTHARRNRPPLLLSQDPSLPDLVCAPNLA